jgi:hypothetical protein
MASMMAVVKRCTPILLPEKASEITPRVIIPTVCVKYRRPPQENTFAYSVLFPKVVSFLDNVSHVLSGDPKSLKKYLFFKEKQELNSS